MKKLTAAAMALLSAAAMSFTAAAPAVTQTATTMSASAADTNNDDWIHAKGSRLYDMNGNEVWLTGANWFGFNCTENVPHYLWSGDIDDMVREIADYGINVLRIPVSTELFYSWMIDEPLPIKSVNPNNDPSYSINVDLINPDGSIANSRQTFDVLMAKCKKYGVKMFVDIHSPDSNNSGHNYGIWYGKSMTNFDVLVDTDLWIETLAWVADEYKNDDTLIGFDLKNEPHSKYGGGPVDAIWDDSNAPNNWKKASEDCANAILAKNPNALILIEGVEGFEGHGAWWGGNLRGVEKYPVTPTSGTSQIMYSPHDYGPIVSAQSWFEKDFTEQTLLDDYWYDTWAYLVDKDKYPLLIGEWGGRIPDTVNEEELLSTPSSSLDDTEKNVKWLILLRNYMIKNHINHTFWCLNDDSGDTGGLWKNITFSGATGTAVEWDKLKYSLFEPSLWQTLDSGKYIGLDHQVALGKNGISLNEFYSDYAATEGSNIDGGTKSGGTPVIPDATTTTTTEANSTTTTTATTTAVTTTTGKDEYMLQIEKYPTKTVYEIGEPLDLDGGYASGYVHTADGAYGDTFSQPFTSEFFKIDSSQFDNTKPGTYTIIISYGTAKQSFEVTVNPPKTNQDDVLYGDANCDGEVALSDAVLILQSLAAPDLYDVNGTNKGHISQQGKINSDCSGNGDGVTPKDALAVQKYLAKIIQTLPEKD